MGVGLLVSLVPAAREVPGLITPHRALALAALCSCPRPRGRPGAPLGPRSPRGSRRPSGASLGAVPGARAVAADPEWGRAPPWAAGRRARPPVSASESRGWAVYLDLDCAPGRRRAWVRGPSVRERIGGRGAGQRGTGWAARVLPDCLESRGWL